MLLVFREKKSRHAPFNGQAPRGQHKRNSLIHQRSVCRHAIRPVDAELGDGGASNRGQTDEPRSRPRKMLSSDVAERLGQNPFFESGVGIIFKCAGLVVHQWKEKLHYRSAQIVLPKSHLWQQTWQND